MAEYFNELKHNESDFTSSHDPQDGRGNNVNTTVVRPAEPSLRQSLPFYTEFADDVTGIMVTSPTKVVMRKH